MEELGLLQKQLIECQGQLIARNAQYGKAIAALVRIYDAFPREDLLAYEQEALEEAGAFLKSDCFR
jgi:hypothetical protein